MVPVTSGLTTGGGGPGGGAADAGIGTYDACGAGTAMAAGVNSRIQDNADLEIILRSYGRERVYGCRGIQL